MTDDLKVRVLEQGDEQFDEMAIAVELYRSIMAAAVESPTPNDLSTHMSAAMVFAGTIFGSMIIGGIVRDQDKRRAVESAAHNFREGIEIGKRRALRIMQEEMGGTA